MSAAAVGRRSLDRLDHLQRYWFSRNAVAATLLPLSWVFRALVVSRRVLWRLRNRVRSRLPVPVVVVGNITVGGSGKTPLVIWLAALLKASGFKPGVISRGYRGAAREWPQLVTGISDPSLVGDEPVLIALRSDCPTAVAPRRNDAARALLDEQACDVLISDDGMQHYALVRDVEIAVVDAQQGLGNGWCLPAGPLREPPARLREVDLVIVHGASEVAYGAKQFRMRVQADRVINLRDAAIRKPLADFSAEPIHAVAGIGYPDRFFEMLRAHGIELQQHAFPDHYRFTAEDLDFGDLRPVLMTEKDAVKCRPFARRHHWYVPIAAAPDEGLAEQVLAILRSRTAALSAAGAHTMEPSPNG